MIYNKTVIINAGGMGKRLGIGTTKALVNVCGKPLIIRLLEGLSEVKDIRIVVGYQSEKVIEVVNEFRKDVIFVFNNDYQHNGVAAGVCMALPGAQEYIVDIDGDMIIHPDDLKMLLNIDGEFVCGGKIDSDDPVMLSVNENGEVVSFSRETGEYEWNGVCCLKTSRIIKSDKYVYQFIEPLLPIKHVLIRTKEIDTPNDYYRAEKWVENNYSDDVVLGVLGGMGSFATLFMFEQILNKFPAKRDWERPRIIIDNNCTMPSRVRAIMFNEKNDQLINEMTSSLSHLIDAGATDIILACNTSHVFLEKIYQKNQKLKRYIHNIIEITADYCKNNKIDNAYLLASEGTIISKIYENNFKKNNLKIDYSKKDFVPIREFIECVKQNKITKKNLNDFANFVNNIKNDTVILGCTELPILYEKCKNKIVKKVVNPLELAIDEIKQKYDNLK